MANEYKVTTLAAEVLRDGPAQARVATFAVEVLRSVTSVSSSARRRQVINN